MVGQGPPYEDRSVTDSTTSKPTRTHEFRDPVHAFVHMNSQERAVVDSEPVQRLRYVHQLALTFLVYPGAHHTRFEHVLGTMELADRVFATVAEPAHVSRLPDGFLPPAGELAWWRQTLRMAALCHDLGHLPFSHAAEKLLLSGGRTHERLTWRQIHGEELCELWRRFDPPLDPEIVAKISLGPEEASLAAGREVPFTPWERLLSEIIVGDAFGVDRMDYLLRDSHYTGVGNGRFDHYRLIESMRILPASESNASRSPGDRSDAPLSLGIVSGGLRSAEALALARYFMYSQVYHHPVRRAYNLHLQEFLREWGGGGEVREETDWLALTDSEVLAAMRATLKDASHPARDSAERILRRRHFRVLYELNPLDDAKNPRLIEEVYALAIARFGRNATLMDRSTRAARCADFPILARDGRILQSCEVSEVMKTLVPEAKFGYVFLAPERLADGREWLRGALPRLLAG